MRAHLFRLGRETAIYGTGQVLLRLVSLLLLPLYTSYLTPTDYGISGVLGVMTYFATPVFALGISGALGVVYYARSDHEWRSATIWTAFVTVAGSATLLSLVGWVSADSLAALFFPGGQPRYDLGYLVLLSLVTAGMSIATQPLLARLQFEERAKTFVAITVTSSGLAIALSVLLIVVLRRGVAGFIEAAAISQAFALAGAMVISLRRLPFSLRGAIARELLGLGLPLVPGFLAMFVMLQANKYILQAGAGLDELGIYTVGFNVGLFMTLVVSGFTTAWFPFFSSFMQEQAQARLLFARVLSYYVLGVGAVSLLFFVAAQPLIDLMAHPSFAGAYVAVGPSAAAQFLIGVHSILLAGMYFAKEVRSQVLVQGAAAAVSVVLNLVLVPIYGAGGAAIGLVLGFVAMIVLQHVWNVRRLQYHVPYEWPRLAVFGTIYLATAAFFLLDRDISLLAEMVLSAVGALVVGGMVIALLSPAERSWARAQIASRLVGGARAEPSG